MTDRDPRLEAADWLAVLGDDSFGELEARALEDWLAASEENRRALASLAMKSRKLTPMADLPEFITLRADALNRMREESRHPLRWISALIILLAFGSGMAYRAYEPHVMRIETQRGDMSSTTLADGSVVEANSATRIEVQLDPLQRRVRLLQGEATFRVRPQWWRPFSVKTNDLTVQALGTVFDVAESPKESRVVVSDGSVRVETPSGRFDRVNTGYKLIYYRQLRDTTLDHAQLDKDLAWHEGRLRFDAAPLSDVVAEFARYNSVRIDLADPELETLPVSGDFDSHAPLAFARAVANLRGLVVSEPSPGRILLEK